MLLQYSLQNWFLWVWVDFIVPESLPIADPCPGPAGSCPLFHLLQVIVYAVLLAEPEPLTLVLGQHGFLCFERRGYVNGEVGNHDPPVSIGLGDGVEKVERRKGR